MLSIRCVNTSIAHMSIIGSSKTHLVIFCWIHGSCFFHLKKVNISYPWLVISIGALMLMIVSQLLSIVFTLGQILYLGLRTNRMWYPGVALSQNIGVILRLWLKSKDCLQFSLKFVFCPLFQISLLVTSSLILPYLTYEEQLEG